jgi:hypothetical protein
MLPKGRPKERKGRKEGPGFLLLLCALCVSVAKFFFPFVLFVLFVVHRNLLDFRGGVCYRHERDEPEDARELVLCVL